MCTEAIFVGRFLFASFGFACFLGNFFVKGLRATENGGEEVVHFLQLLVRIPRLPREATEELRLAVCGSRALR